jgi:hypothetical protein
MARGLTAKGQSLKERHSNSCSTLFGDGTTAKAELGLSGDTKCAGIASLRARGFDWKRIANDLAVGVGTIHRFAAELSKIREKVFGTLNEEIAEGCRNRLHRRARLRILLPHVKLFRVVILEVRLGHQRSEGTNRRTRPRKERSPRERYNAAPTQTSESD